MTYLSPGEMAATRFGITDEDAVDRAKTGDDRAAEWLFLRYRNLVERQARTYFVVGADHEDVIQEGMMGLWKAIRDFRSDKLPRFAPFAELCVTRQIITAVKTATRQKHGPLNGYISLSRSFNDDEAEGTLIDVIADRAGANPEDMLMRTRLPRNLPRALEETLSPLELVVVRRYLDSKTYHEIAGELICGTKSIDNALQRAKKKIKRLLVD
ncbi:MAG: RNA polymerase sporulation sigma factor SigH [Fimbriimonadales bacterium]